MTLQRVDVEVADKITSLLLVKAGLAAIAGAS